MRILTSFITSLPILDTDTDTGRDLILLTASSRQPYLAIHQLLGM